MSYTEEDISDLKYNLENYQGITYLGDVDAESGEITRYWQPTIGLYKGLSQFDIKGDFLALSNTISSLLWEKLSLFYDEGLYLLVSVNNYKKWLEIHVDRNVDIVDAFELYESEPEFVAIDRARKVLFAVHVEYPSDGKYQLWVYFYKIETDNDGNITFVKG